MNYAGFSSALSNIRRGASPAEIGMWLGASAIGGVADTMERRREQAREDARYAQELAFRQKYQDAQLGQMQHAQERQDTEDRLNNGYMSSELVGGPMPETKLPTPTAAYLAAPVSAKAFSQPPLSARVQPPPPRLVPKVIKGRYQQAQELQSRKMDIEERRGDAEEKLLALKVKGMELEQDPTNIGLQQDFERARTEAQRASSAAAYANAGESRARAGLYSAKTGALTDNESSTAGTFAKRFGLSESVYRGYLSDFKKELAGPMPDPIMNAPAYDAWRVAMQKPADMQTFLPWLSTKTGKTVAAPGGQAQTATPLASAHETSVKTWTNAKTGRDEQFRLSEDGQSWVKIGS